MPDTVNEQTPSNHSDEISYRKSLVLSSYIPLHIICLLGNTVVLLVICKHPKMQDVTNFLLANLAAADLCVAIFCTGQRYMLTVLDEEWIFGSGIFGRGLCKAYGFVRGVAYMTSINILVLISLERFLAIVHPFRSRVCLLSRTKLKFGVTFAWILSCVISLPNAFSFDTFTNYYYENISSEAVWISQTGCSRNYMLPFMSWEVYDLIIFVLWYLIPAIIMTVLYSFVGRRLWRSSSSADLGMDGSQRHTISLRSYLSTSEGGSLRYNQGNKTKLMAGINGSMTKKEMEQRCILQNRKKVIRIFIIIVAAFMVCWLPLHIRKLMLYAVGYTDILGDFLLPFSDWLINLNSALNPIIYTLFSERFRSCAVDVIKCQVDKKRWVRTRVL